MLAACVYLIEMVCDEKPCTITVNTLPPDERFRFHMFAHSVQRWLSSEDTWN